MLNKIVYGMMLALLLVGILASSIQPAKASVTMFVTIYIRADGTIEPEEALQCINTTDYVTYILTDDIVSYAVDYGIIVERGNITIDGQGYAVQAFGFYGVSLNSINNVTIRNMRIKANLYGICLEYSSNNTIIENNIANNTSGIYLEYSSNNTITKNNITNNMDGIDFKYSDDNTIIENNIANSNGTGIKLAGSCYNIIFGNNVTNNKQTCMWLNEALNNTIYYNWFVDNAVNKTKEGASQIAIRGRTENFWDNGAIGNYWSDYTGYDGNGDGIGDDPYVVDEKNKDRFPIWTVPPPPSIPIELIAAAVIIVIAGVTVFIIRRKRKKA